MSDFRIGEKTNKHTHVGRVIRVDARVVRGIDMLDALLFAENPRLPLWDRREMKMARK